MQRIYYGTITIDVADEVADLLPDVVRALSNSVHTRIKPFAGGRGSIAEPYQAGRPDFIELSGYLNGLRSSTSVRVLVGGSVPIALAPIHSEWPDPPGTADDVRRMRDVLEDSNEDD